MQTSASIWRFTEDYLHRTDPTGLTCDECGKTFQKPILARVSTSGNTQTYRACPHCMTKVRSIEVTKTKERRPAVFSKDSGESATAFDSNVKCSHFFGYLNKRQKGAAVPERCLVCAKMVDCLYG